LPSVRAQGQRDAPDRQPDQVDAAEPAAAYQIIGLPASSVGARLPAYGMALLNRTSDTWYA